MPTQTTRYFRCSTCRLEWMEEDCQQVQPDGHLACPDDACGDDTLVETT